MDSVDEEEVDGDDSMDSRKEGDAAESEDDDSPIIPFDDGDADPEEETEELKTIDLDSHGAEDIFDTEPVPEELESLLSTPVKQRKLAKVCFPLLPIKSLIDGCTGKHRSRTKPSGNTCVRQKTGW